MYFVKRPICSLWLLLDYVKRHATVEAYNSKAHHGDAVSIEDEISSIESFSDAEADNMEL